jgi:hypothetical protein
LFLAEKAGELLFWQFLAKPPKKSAVFLFAKTGDILIE